jgi:fucose 4-O-acetylase-like acetyltransferase
MEMSLQQSNQLKAIAILMMLFMHLFSPDYHGLFEPLIFIGKQPLSAYLALFSDACVPIFCFVSGYGLYFKYRKQPENYIKNNARRIGRLYINYWIVLLIFAVALGSVLDGERYPGSFQEFMLNFMAWSNSYNDAWWFFFTYILLTATSSLFFRLLDRYPVYALISASLTFYLVAFYFRVYKSNLFDAELLKWTHKQVALFGTSFFPFIIGAIALKYQWSGKISKRIENMPYKNLFLILALILLIVLHGLIPNFIIAPFTAVSFIFIYTQMGKTAKNRATRQTVTGGVIHLY